MRNRDLFPALTAACLFTRERARTAAPDPSARRRAVVRRFAASKDAAACG